VVVAVVVVVVVVEVARLSARVREVEAAPPGRGEGCKAEDRTPQQQQQRRQQQRQHFILPPGGLLFVGCQWLLVGQ
jgi:hypothetical protein